MRPGQGGGRGRDSVQDAERVQGTGSARPTGADGPLPLQGRHAAAAGRSVGAPHPRRGCHRLAAAARRLSRAAGHCRWRAARIR